MSHEDRLWWPHTLRNNLRHLEGCLVSMSPREEEEPVSCVCLCCALGDVRHTLAAVCSVYTFRSSLCCPVYTGLLLAWPESVVSPVHLSHPKSRWCSKAFCGWLLLLWKLRWSGWIPFTVLHESPSLHRCPARPWSRSVAFPLLSLLDLELLWHSSPCCILCCPQSPSSPWVQVGNGH